MENYTLDTDFSSLSGPEANRWLDDFTKMAEAAFTGRDHAHRLLGNLLVLERYIHTLRQGLRTIGGRLSRGTESALDALWDCLEGRASPVELAGFANNLYACLLDYDVGESLTEEQAEFEKAYFSGVDYLRAGEDTAAGWAFCLLLQLVAIDGGRLDYDEFAKCREVDFSGVKEMLDLFDDACIELTGTPCPSSRAGSFLRAIEEVHLTPLYRSIIACIQQDLRTARDAPPEQYAALREAYREKTILPEECAAAFLEY